MASGPTGRPATIYDVAALAKLSIATVSRVLQGTGPVSAKARARVDQAAQELNYVPLRAARSLAVQRHEAHGLVLPDLAGPFYGDLLMGYERWAGEHGQSVIITVGHGNPRSIRDLASRVDGMVVHADAVADPTIQDLRKAGVPIVLIAHPPIPGCDSVRSENLLSAEQLTGRLLDSGRKDLLFVGDPATPYDAPARYAGFCNAHTNRGLSATGAGAGRAQRGLRRAVRRTVAAGKDVAGRSGLRERRDRGGRDEGPAEGRDLDPRRHRRHRMGRRDGGPVRDAGTDDSASADRRARPAGGATTA